MKFIAQVLQDRFWRNAQRRKEQEALFKPCILRQRSAERAAVAQHDSTGVVAMYTLLPRRCYKGKRLVTSSSAVPTYKCAESGQNVNLPSKSAIVQPPDWRIPHSQTTWSDLPRQFWRQSLIWVNSSPFQEAWATHHPCEDFPGRHPEYSSPSRGEDALIPLLPLASCTTTREIAEL